MILELALSIPFSATASTSQYITDTARLTECRELGLIGAFQLVKDPDSSSGRGFEMVFSQSNEAV
jgi:adenosylmethionine-8-amino-7-oxononanoate aminotransferase